MCDSVGSYGAFSVGGCREFDTAEEEDHPEGRPRLAGADSMATNARAPTDSVRASLWMT